MYLILKGVPGNNIRGIIGTLSKFPLIKVSGNLVNK